MFCLFQRIYISVLGSAAAYANMTYDVTLGVTDLPVPEKLDKTLLTKEPLENEYEDIPIKNEK